MFHCPVGVWVIEQRAIILSATVRSPTVNALCWCIPVVQQRQKYVLAIRFGFRHESLSDLDYTLSFPIDLGKARG